MAVQNIAEKIRNSGSDTPADERSGAICVAAIDSTMGGAARRQGQPGSRLKTVLRYGVLSALVMDRS